MSDDDSDHKREPHNTGSDAVAGSSAGAARTVPTFTKDDLLLDDTTRRWGDVILAGVNKVARENAKCIRLDPSSAYVSSRGTDQDPVFFVTCDAGGMPFNVWFAASDVQAGKTMAAAPLIDKVAAVAACERQAQAAAMNPSTVEFSRFMHLAINAWADGRTRVQSQFTAKNSFNLELTYNISCLFQGEELIETSIEEAV